MLFVVFLTSAVGYNYYVLFCSGQISRRQCQVCATVDRRAVSHVSSPLMAISLGGYRCGVKK